MTELGGHDVHCTLKCRGSSLWLGIFEPQLDSQLLGQQYRGFGSMPVVPSRTLKLLSLRTCMLGLNVKTCVDNGVGQVRCCCSGVLLDYCCPINGYANRYSNFTWPLLYQCDVRCWLGHVERVRTVLERDCAVAETRGLANCAMAG